MVLFPVIVNEQLVHMGIPDESITSAAMKGPEFGVMVKDYWASTGVFPPCSFVVFDGIDTEKSAMTEVCIRGSRVLVVNAPEVSQFADRNKTSS
jgi:hypothetical protein